MGRQQISAVALAVALGGATCWATPAFAQTAGGSAVTQEDLAAMRAQMTAMAQRITSLEAQLAAAKQVPGSPQLAASAPAMAAPAQSAAPAQVAVAPSGPAAPQAAPAAGASSGQSLPAQVAKAASGIRIRGYTQVRFNEIVSGDKDAPAGRSRLRSVHDGSIGPDSNFFIRRLRLVFQGDLGHGVSFYLQPDFAAAVNSQSVGERRDNYLQLRDAYVDVALDKAHRLKLRVGQSKIPFGWENLQSSGNRVPLDRSDAMNSAVPSERDLGVVAYYTPTHVQQIWDDLEHQGQKLFGNYGAFGAGVFNGQGVNRPERNESVMSVAMATWPFRLDGIGLDGQVLEVGGAVLHNKVRPEVRAGGVTEANFEEHRVGLHAILYPKPFGIQAEWNFGKAPEFDTASQAIQLKKASGGYVMAMYRIAHFGGGTLIPYARWERYKGGWKAAVNAPRLDTNDIELGVEWAPIKPLELTLAYARMKRAEADERRSGQAEGDVLRAQLQWNY
ncbi:porin [Novosphingobium gossypii]|uniref:porin n=1 Tax=Novosphingobium gossypii TaxID=1604774 RepID=UPI003D197B7C